MKLLAWDTSSKAGVLVAMQWQEGESRPTVVSEWALNVEATHSERLLWAVHEMLEASRWRLEEVDIFGVGIGPGSFTGLRIGVTTARTLAQTLNKPLIGVSSLAVLARPVAENFQSQKKSVLVVAATDACKGELFALWGLAKAVTGCVVMKEGDLPGVWVRGVEEQVIEPEKLMVALQKKIKLGKADVSWICVGEGRSRYSDIWNMLPKNREIKLPHSFQDQVQGRYLGVLVWEAFQAGLSRQALQVHPRYLRASDAELKLKKLSLPGTKGAIY